MIKKLTKSGNSLALVIDKSILDLLNITADTPLRISTTNGRSLQITTVENEIGAEEISGAMERFNKKYGGMMKRLAE